jgi:uncharacterized membrane protein
MKSRHFLQAVDHDRIVAAIAAAEKQTSGQIRVYVSKRKRKDALAYAKRRFTKLKMQRLPHRNGVLIFLAPLTHRFAVVGDTQVHAQCGDEFWKEVIAAMEPLLKEGKFTEAIVQGVQKVGTILAKHFPPQAGDQPNLPDSVIEE